MPNTGPEWEPFSAALAAADALDRSLVPLRQDRESTSRALGEALKRLDTRDDALLLLATLDTDITEALLVPLLRAALRVRDTLTVRHLLGRLPRSTAEAAVPSAVWALLDETEDGDDYRRMAEMLDHLGLDTALRDLTVRAHESTDEEVREVAADFGSE
ncbi:hypothetical protein [Streptomyces sp. 3N207]|uniref:hypothetical protein n=1 Tax=Streptomyces sp. 3N207 TaxID=3457417 RepID=UPI003FD60FD7